jgi:hypothetical protein
LLFTRTVVLWSSGIQKPAGKNPFGPYANLRGKNIILAVILSSYVISFFLYFYDPSLFNALAEEDSLAESLSALFCFLGMGTFISLAVYHYKKSKTVRSISFWFAFLSALLCFLIGMEEVSWFQRVLSYETPAMFSGNDQGEMNLHNLATGDAQNDYYLGAFLVFIVLAFIGDRFSFGKKCEKIIRPFIPSRYMIFAASLAAAYDYEQWSDFHPQLYFFTTFFIMFFYAFIDRESRGVFLKVFCLAYLLQVFFVICGGDSLSGYRILEYKECFIALAIAIYSLEVFANRDYHPEIS